MHTSPNDDARLLLWIDATGETLAGSTIGSASGGLPEIVAGSSPAPRTEQLDWQYGPYAPGDSTILSIIREASKGYARLMACLMHSDDVRCEVCQDDPI